jgi:hypothetical protein
MSTTAEAMDIPSPTTATSISAGNAAILQIAPGLASVPVFALLAWMFSRQGVPNIFALTLTIILIEIPLCWAIMVHRVRQETGRFRFRDAFPWTDSIPWWQYLVIGVPLIFFSMFMIVGIVPRVDALLLNGAFNWVPDWFAMRPDPGMFATMSRPLLMTLWVLMLFGMVIGGGFTQELYSRGFLLPRTAHLGWWAPALNALLFAMLHMAAPWSWPVFFVMTLPWAYLVWWRRSVKIGLFIHVGMLALQWMVMTLVLFGVVEVPG